MKLGGVLLGAGMELTITPADHRMGDGPISFMLHRVVGLCTEQGCDWVVLDGLQRPSPTTTWLPRRLHVRVDALRRAMGIPT